MLDASGFLDLPASDAWWLSVDERPRPLIDLVGQRQSFVLLAPGGAGKSWALRELQHRELDAITVHLSVLDKAGMHRELENAVATGRPVYIDAVDEAALHEAAVFRILEHHLTTAQAAGVPWRLACRPTAWNPALADALESSLPGFEQLRLLPLTREAVADLVSSTGADPAGFLDELASANLGRLAASPMRLRAAANQWRSTGHLPDSQLDAIRFEIGQLLTETDPAHRPPTVPTDRRWRIAARLATITVFGRASRFTNAAEVPAGALRVFDLPSAAEPDEPGTLVASAEYEVILGTALFDAAADGGVSFRHQQYAEFLSATYLSGRQIVRSKLSALLGVDADGALPGVMTGVAAWLGTLNPELADDLFAANAAEIAKAGVELPSHHLRSVVVGGVLAAAVMGNMDLEWGLDLSPLAYPGLEEQLVRDLNRGPESAEQLWWIARLAVAGGCRSLSAVLLREALDPAWPIWARRAAVTAVAALGGDEDLQRLRPLLRLAPADDGDDDVLAATIEALYPRILSVAELLEVLRPQRNTSYLGPYYILLGELSGQFPACDLPDVLAWGSAHVQDGEDAYGPMFSRLVRRGWDHAESPATCAALAQLIAALAGDDRWPHWPGRDKLPWADAQPEKRRSLAVDVAGNIGAGQCYELLDLGLVISDDLGWLLRELPQLPSVAQDALAACIPYLARNPTAGDADLILGMPESHPAYEHTEGLRQPVRVDSDLAVRWRHQRERAAADQSLLAASRAERSTQLAAVLGEARNDPDCWWRVAYWLAASDRDHGSGTVFSHDLTDRPGWPLLGEREHRDVLDLGVRYLTVHELQPSTWAGHPSAGQQAVADWSGVYLLTTLADHDPGRLAALGENIWQAWAPAIVGAWNSGEEDEPARCRLVDLTPPSVKQSIHDAALSHLDALQAHGGRLSNRQLYEHLCPALAPTLTARLTDGTYTGQLARALLDMLISAAPQAAHTTCQRIFSQPQSALAVDARHGLARLDPASVIDDLETNNATPADIADLAPYISITGLDDHHLAALARLLLRCVPFASDPAEQHGMFWTDTQHEMRSLRRGVMDLLAQHGQAGFFENLAQPGDSGHQIVGWYLRQARARAADIAYTGLTPGQLLELLSRSDARLVRHDRDLLEVVLNLLDDLNHELTHLHVSRYLWDHSSQGSTPMSEDDISDWVRRELGPKLTAASTFDREVQVARRKPGIGTRIDLKATTPTATQPPNTAQVIAEAKLVTNASLMTAMQDQLIQKYLIPAGLQHGIYLVYWIAPDQRPAGSPKDPTDRDELMRRLTQQAAVAGNDLHIHPYVLDISHP